VSTRREHSSLLQGEKESGFGDPSYSGEMGEL
jgi:hypothetical protein